MVSSFLRLGKGHAGSELFALVTGMNAMDKKSFSKHIKILSEENSEMKHQILEVARNIVRKQHLDLNDEEKKEMGVLDITVSFDGSWQKRGYKSLYGIGVVIDLLTGLVIDYEILSKYCTECTAAVRDLSGDSPDFAIWYEGHKSECQINHIGSSSSMEMEAAAILWQRSIKECNMRYTCILSDGDSKTFQHLMSLNIYGKGKPIKKRGMYQPYLQAPRNRFTQQNAESKADPSTSQWASNVGWILAAFALIQIPLWFIVEVYRTPHSGIIKKFLNALKPAENWGPSNPLHFNEWKTQKDSRLSTKIPKNSISTIGSAYANDGYKEDVF
ncbi:uncharacterized protein TNCV_3062971 [Trichonephila clavipes]|nr:uncharacterized protein TNCV_3062971 [Trichonephila clavipes]